MEGKRGRNDAVTAVCLDCNQQVTNLTLKHTVIVLLNTVLNNCYLVKIEV